LNPIRITVDLIEDQLVTFHGCVAPESDFVNRLNEALRARHTSSSGDAVSFCFTGTVGPRIGRAVLLAKAAEIEQMPLRERSTCCQSRSG
jgi:hypothetical protein